MRITLVPVLRSILMAEDDKEKVEVTCPKCGAVVRIAREKAEKENRVDCPKGHEIVLFKAL